jgi:DNA-binding NarL/FixJ family response regulator
MNSGHTSPVHDATTRVVVVDADRRVQQSVTEVLRIAGVNVVGMAGSVRTALELISTHEPGVVLVDPHLPDPEAGASLISSVARGWPGTRVVVMGWPGSRSDELPSADAFVSKSAAPEEFVSATIAACGC